MHNNSERRKLETPAHVGTGERRSASFTALARFFLFFPFLPSVYFAAASHKGCSSSAFAALPGSQTYNLGTRRYGRIGHFSIGGGCVANSPARGTPPTTTMATGVQQLDEDDEAPSPLPRRSESKGGSSSQPSSLPCSEVCCPWQ